jgi:hypothetical protein
MRTLWLPVKQNLADEELSTAPLPEHTPTRKIRHDSKLQVKLVWRHCGIGGAAEGLPQDTLAGMGAKPNPDQIDSH